MYEKHGTKESDIAVVNELKAILADVEKAMATISDTETSDLMQGAKLGMNAVKNIVAEHLTKFDQE